MISSGSPAVTSGRQGRQGPGGDAVGIDRDRDALLLACGGRPRGQLVQVMVQVGPQQAQLHRMAQQQPAGGGRAQGRLRTISTVPACASSVRSRCDTADCVIDSRAAARSKPPSSTMAARHSRAWGSNVLIRCDPLGVLMFSLRV
jgi:hypothetical protein